MDLKITHGIFLTLALPFSLSASLGRDATSVREDQAEMQGTLRTSSADSYTLHEIQTPTGVAVKEYASPVGKVFAVTWKGPVHPDLRQLLGPYFDEYTQAVQAQRAQHRSRAPATSTQARAFKFPATCDPSLAKHTSPQLRRGSVRHTMKPA
jgi:hypothetical protein